MNTVSQIVAVILLLRVLFMPLPGQAADLPDFATLVKNYGSVVVNINVTLRNIPVDTKEFVESAPGRELPSPKQENDEQAYVPNSFGSGFIIGDDGYILTSAHVVDKALEIEVKLKDKREYSAKIVGLDRRSDVALLKIDARGLPTAVIGDPKTLRVGDWVLAIGTPFGFDYSASTGIVSALGRSLPDDYYIPFIQTDAAINPGNSGGPLFNLKGEVVGMNAQIFSRTGGFMGLSFAVPIDLVMHISRQLKQQGQVRWGWLGCAIQDVNRELASAFGVDEPRGALITDILLGSPAFKSALKVGDIVTSYEDQPIGLSSELPPLVGLSAPDSRVTLEIYRDGKKKTIKVTVGELNRNPPEAPPQLPARAAGDDRTLGLVLSELTLQDRKRLRATHGVLVRRIAHGPAHAAGIQQGDIILELNGNRINNPVVFYRLLDLADKSRPLPIRIKRGEQSMYLALKPTD